jgi:hypothetical protein
LKYGNKKEIGRRERERGEEKERLRVFQKVNYIKR